MTDTTLRAVDRERLVLMIAQLRRMRASYSTKRSNTDPLYHALSHAVHDLTNARGLMNEEIVHLPEPLQVEHQGARPIADGEHWHDGQVGIDFDSSSGIGPYPAQISDVRWNGFAAPRFTPDVAERVMNDSTDPNDAHWSSWRWEGDTIVAQINREVIDFGSDATDAEYVSRYEPDADGMYHIGSWEWTWEDRP